MNNILWRNKRITLVANNFDDLYFGYGNQNNFMTYNIDIETLQSLYDFLGPFLEEQKKEKRAKELDILIEKLGPEKILMELKKVMP